MRDTAAGVIAGATRFQAARITNRSSAHEFRIRQQRTEVNKMEYLIVIGVVAMMALYALIIAGCLKQPEW